MFALRRLARPVSLPRTVQVRSLLKPGVSMRRSMGTEAKEEPIEYVNVTFVDIAGNTKKFKAEVGETLLRTCRRARLMVPAFCEGGGYSLDKKHGIMPLDLHNFGPAPQCRFCFLNISNDYIDIVDKQNPRNIWEMLGSTMDFRQFETSRYGCQITVTKEMEGLTIGVPDYGSIVAYG